jgi:CheY-like chemotaxis protein
MEPTVLYAEDDVNDITLMELVVARCGENLRLRVVRDGSQAIAYLKSEGKFTEPGSAPTPSLILLDVKMPKLTGIEVLEWVRRQEGFAGVAVVMISSSMQETDVLRAYQLGANAYIRKPSAFKAFEQTVSGALRFFLSVSQTGPS